MPANLVGSPPGGFTAISHDFVMDWAAIWKDVVAEAGATLNYSTVLNILFLTLAAVLNGPALFDR